MTDIRVTGQTVQPLLPPGPPALNIPFSEEAEAATIGCVLMNPLAYVALRDFLKPDDFMLLKHRWIWEAFEALHSDPKMEIDYLTACDALRKAGHLDDIGGPAYLTKTGINVPSSTRATVYAQLVKRDSVRRGLLEAADRMKAIALDTDKSVEMGLDIMRKEIGKAGKAIENGSSISFQEAISQHYDELEALLKKRADNPNMTLGIPSGFATLDRLFDGFRPGDVTTIAGVTGTGKTALTFSFAVNALKSGYKAALFSGEMSRQATLSRLIANASQKLRADAILQAKLTADELKLYHTMIKDISAWKLELWDNTRLRIGGLEGWIRRLKETGLVDIVFLDGLFQIDNYRQNREKRWDIADIMNGLEALAVELDLPIVVTHQLSRAAYNEEPQKSHMSESSSVEQKSARILFVWQQQKAEWDSLKQRRPSALKIGKNRHGGGENSTIPLWFYAYQTRYCEQEADHAPKPAPAHK